ncbi:hypothetical protein NDK43_06900 [Neobacillus pocheonensis]|uniref:DUF5659 domain-containing protein n=1 Tax=Neobacillus pocheonensis TaxID=363869 RepID=A0ABT0W842_9BACI|nr:hypothetical protein [Neobacillus pocheonensis]
MKAKRIFTKSVAEALIRMGHKVKGYETNKKNDKLIIWVFEVTPKFIEDLSSLS